MSDGTKVEWQNMRHLDDGAVCPVARFSGATYFVSTGTYTVGDVMRHRAGGNIQIGRALNVNGEISLLKASDLVLADAGMAT